MARVGGRNTVAAFFAGLLCLGVLAGLVYLAAPLVPAAMDWVALNVERAVWRE